MEHDSINTVVFVNFDSKWEDTSIQKIPVKHILAMTGIGLSGVFVYLVALQIGYSVMPGQQACVINYLWPAMIIIWARFLLKEKLNVGK